MKRLLPLFILTIIFPQSYPGDDAVRNGVHAFYNYETAKAIEILDQARREFPENPTVHLTWAAARWLHNQANSTVEQTYLDLETDLNAVIPVYVSLVEKYPNDSHYPLYLGSSTGLMARIYLGKKEWFETLKWAYSGFKIISKVEADHPEIADAALPIGIVEYYASLSNIIIQWGAALFGLEPTQAAGLEKIERAAREGQWSWIEAKGILSFIYLWVDLQPDKALFHSRKLVKTYPKNYYFRVLYTESLIRSGKLEEAFSSLKQLQKSYADLTEIQKKWYYGYMQYEFALYHFKKKEYEKSMVYINEAVYKYGAELDIILANAWYLKGQLHDVKGARKEAIEAYKNCIELDNYTYTIDISKKYLNSPFTD